MKDKEAKSILCEHLQMWAADLIDASTKPQNMKLIDIQNIAANMYELVEQVNEHPEIKKANTGKGLKRLLDDNDLLFTGVSKTDLETARHFMNKSRK